MFCENRKAPLLVGSVKSHSGHAEATAAFMSLLKALFALDTGYIAPNMNFTEPHPDLKPIIDGKLKVIFSFTLISTFDDISYNTITMVHILISRW